jgi:hypothetical protein
MPTLTDLAAAGHPFLGRVADDTARQGLAVGKLLGMGGYAVIFEAVCPGHGPCVLKVPCVTLHDYHLDALGLARGPNRLIQLSVTGPFELVAPDSLEEAGALLERACARQRDAGCGRPLARLLDVLSLGELPAALLERAPGISLRSLMATAADDACQSFPSITRALADLQQTFGWHGDLKPDHVFLANGEVVFIDPLTGEDEWHGSIGYILPSLWRAEHDWLGLRDLAALAAMLAEAWGGDVGWDGHFLYRLINLFNGRFGRGIELAAIPQEMQHRLWSVPPSLQEWILEVTEAILQTWELPSPVTLRDSAWCRGRLDALAKCYPRFLPEWRTPTVLGLARLILASPEEGLYSVLADALEEAGCDNEELLKCCRWPRNTSDRAWIGPLAAGTLPSRK